MLPCASVTQDLPAVRVTFLNPGGVTDPFFHAMASFMRRAARDLGIDLEILDSGRDHALMRRRASELLDRATPPEYLLVVNEQGLAAEILPRVGALGIKVLIINEGLLVPEQQKLGKPREIYPTWLGELVPDDQEAGYLLGRRLIASARSRGAGAAAGGIHLCGVAGPFTPSSLLRISGLRRAVAEAGDVQLCEVAPANWSRERAASVTAELLERHPATTVFWAASDEMALGAAAAIEAAGKEPGRDIALGGIDWAPFAFDKIRDGTFVASVGGHFLDGAWALILLFDHHHGRDFGPTQGGSHFALADRSSADEYERLLTQQGVQRVDFSKLSKVRNPALAAYDFSVQSLLS
jgi:ABC-type sugar transport system substrate-binding protein